MKIFPCPFLLFLIYPFGRGETPTSLCTDGSLPYKTKENNCANFSDICVKKNDPECENFYRICSQCPLSNYSILMFSNLLKMENEVNAKFARSDSKTNSLDSKIVQIITDSNKLLSILTAIILLIIMILIILVLEAAFRHKRRFQNCISCRSREYRNARDIPLIGPSEVPTIEIGEMTRQMNEKFEQMEKRFDKILSKITKQTEQMENRFNEILSKITKQTEDLPVPKAQKIGYYNPKDDTYVVVEPRTEGNVNIKAIFDDKDILNIKYSNENCISALRDEVARMKGCSQEYCLLFKNKKYLEEEEEIQKYAINDETILQFFCLERFDPSSNIETVGPAVDTGYVSELYNAKYSSDSDERLLIKYDLSFANVQQFESQLKQLIILRITKSDEIFPPLFGMYKNDSILYEVVEKTDLRLLPGFLNDDNIRENEIGIIAIQVLECLKQLHKNNVTYGFILPENIMVNEKKEFLLNNICLCHFLFGQKFHENLKKLTDLKNIPLSHIAPEVLNGMVPNQKSDVWSFGVLLIYILNKTAPTYQSNQRTNKTGPTLYGEIDYEVKGISYEFKNFIESCVKPDPDRRVQLDELSSHIFIRNFTNPLKK